MHQMTLRVPSDLARNLREVAARRGESVNSYAGRVLAAAVDPDLSGSEIEGLQERLARAGLLAEPTRPGGRSAADEATLAAAREAAGTGHRSLADLVSEGRR